MANKYYECHVRVCKNFILPLSMHIWSTDTLYVSASSIEEAREKVYKIGRRNQWAIAIDSIYEDK